MDSSSEMETLYEKFTEAFKADSTGQNTRKLRRQAREKIQWYDNKGKGSAKSLLNSSKPKKAKAKAKPKAAPAP